MFPRSLIVSALLAASSAMPSLAVTLDDLKGFTLACPTKALNSVDDRYSASQPAERVTKPGTGGLMVYFRGGDQLLVDETCGPPQLYSVPITIGQETRTTVKLCPSDAASPSRISHRAAFGDNALRIEVTSMRHQTFGSDDAGIVERQNYRVAFESAGAGVKARLTGYRSLTVLVASERNTDATHRILEHHLPEPVDCALRDDQPRQPGWWWFDSKS